jgi:peptidoglycan/xylan/chitin deacetylase (PgdA/CDA1 family)
MFHHFHNERHIKGQGSISAETFDDMLHFVGIDNILPAEEWYRRAVTGELKDTDLCITFDDNLLCQYDVAYPVLKHYGLTAFWFIYTSPLQGELERIEVYRHFRFSLFKDIGDFYKAFHEAVQQSIYHQQVEKTLKGFNPSHYSIEFPFYTEEDRIFRYVRDQVLGPQPYNKIMDQMIEEHNLDIEQLRGQLWMNEAHLKKLDQEGHLIGLHSHTHPTNIGDLPQKEQKYEYEKNAEILTNLLGKKPLTMSHPCNSYNPETLQLLKQLGIKLGFRANMFGSYHSPYEFPREDHANILKQMEEKK